MDSTMRPALEAAAKRLCICDGVCFETRHGMMHGPCERRMGETAAAIATFLRHFRRGANLHSFTLPDAWGSPFPITIETQRLDALAAAVEQTALEKADE